MYRSIAPPGGTLGFFCVLVVAPVAYGEGRQGSLIFVFTVEWSLVNIDASIAPRNCHADSFFSLCASGTIALTHFNLTKSFLTQLVSRLDTDSYSTRVGLVSFSSRVRTSANVYIKRCCRTATSSRVSSWHHFRAGCIREYRFNTFQHDQVVSVTPNPQVGYWQG